MTYRPPMTLRRLLATAAIACASCGPGGASPQNPLPVQSKAPSAQPPDASAGALGQMSSALAGTWCWPNINNGSHNPHSLRFSADGQKLFLEYSHPHVGADGKPHLGVEYDVESIDPKQARMRLVGETRKTDAGEPVVWDLVVLPAERYCWRRTDWKADACTDPVTRCPPPAKYDLACPGATPPDEVDARIVLVQWAGARNAGAAISRSKEEALARATDCLNRIRNGEDFAAIVEQCSDEPGATKHGGRLGTIARGKLEPALSDAAFSLCVSEVSDPIESVFGYAILFRTK